MQFQDPSVESVLDSIRRIVRWLRVFSRKSEKDHGLSAAQLFVLQKLDARRGVSVNEIAERTLTHQSSASVVVSRLVERGLAVRAQSAEDRRRTEIRLSKKGQAILRNAPEPVQERLVAAVRSLPSRERHELARLLSKVLIAARLDRTPASLFFEEEGVPHEK